MLKNDIEKTLQAHCPEPPEGFAERMDNKAISLMQKKHNENENKGRSGYRLAVLAAAVVLVLCFMIPASRNLIIRPDSIRARETATPLVMALSEGHGEVTEGEGLSQEAREALEVNFPGVADKLKPVNLSCEKQGIRMKVLSALAEGNESWVVYSLQDLEGDRINRFAASYVDLIGIGDNPGYSCYLEHNQAEHKVTCVYYEAYSEQNYPEDSSLTFEAADLGIEQELKIDLVPYLREYGKTSDGVKAPEDASVYSTLGDVNYARSVKVLEDTDPLNVNLYKDVYLTGIGWINDQLHVRIQDRQQETITIGPMSVPPAFLSVAAFFPDTGRQCDMCHVGWSSAGNEYRDQNECILYMSPDEADKTELAALGTEIVDVVRDTWEVQIPADSIRAGIGTNADSEYKTDEFIADRLWFFLAHWSREDTRYLLKTCSDEWKTAKEDPEQAARELMKSGKPRGYIINGISGKYGDPTRTLNVTVQWDAKNGEYTYSRYNVEVRLQHVTADREEYFVDPDGFGNSLPVGTVFEEKLKLVTEDAILRDSIEAHIPDVPYDELIPIGLSTEKQGIRLEAVSGCVKDGKAYILCALEDTEGKYNAFDLRISTEWNETENKESGSFTSLYRSKAENKSIWLYKTDRMDWLQDRNEILTLDFNQVWIDDEKENDLLPFLKEYGKTVEGVEPPKGSSFAGTRQLADTKELKVLDYNQPLDIPLSGNAKLTGIGWIDDRLHVQIHLVGEAIQTSDGLEHMGATANAVCSVAENADSLIWYDEDGDRFFDWLEYVFDAQPEDVEQSQLTSTVWEQKGILEDNWEIQVPINMLLPENGEDTEAQEETTNQETAVSAG